MNLPNRITISRVVMIVLMIIALFTLEIIGQVNSSFRLDPIWGTNFNIVNFVICVVFVIAASTDWLDGYLARKNNQITDFGKFMDPLADKILVNSILIFLCAPQSYATVQYTIPVFLVVIMLVRDFAVDGLRLIAVQRKRVIAANIFGKMKTVAQMITIPVLLLAGFPFSYFDADWNQYLQIGTILLIITTIVSVLSGIIYFVQNYKVLKEEKKDEQPQ